MKKPISILLCAVLLMSLLAACNNTAPSHTTATTENSVTPVGTLLVSLGATFEIPFDQQGNVVEVKATNAQGEAFLGQVGNFTGRGCVFLVRELLKKAFVSGSLENTKWLVVRLNTGDTSPTNDFLQTIAEDTQYLADEEGTGVTATALSDDDLTADGLITLATAKKLVAKHMDVEPDTLPDVALNADTKLYAFDGYNVDALYGTVTKA